MHDHERRIATETGRELAATSSNEVHWPCPGCGAALCVLADALPDPVPYCGQCADKLANLCQVL